MTSLFEGPAGSTPLEPEDQEGLVPTWIATRADLNAAEQANVARATTWVFGRPWRIDSFSQTWLMNLHRRMFRDVWRWAGTYRRRDTNIGVPWPQISTSVEMLLGDLLAQTDDPGTRPWTADEVGIRFHHRLVSIHPFVNGNGRHARLAADVLVVALGQERYPWGGGSDLAESGAVRDEYLSALRTADRTGDYVPLLRFGRSVHRT